MLARAFVDRRGARGGPLLRALRCRDDMELEGRSPLFESRLHSHSASVLSAFLGLPRGSHVRNGAVARGNQFFLLAFSVLIFDIPRYTFSLVSLALFGVARRNDRVPAVRRSVSVIIPTFNGGSGLEPTIASLHRQTLRPVEIIVVDDGSTDDTRAIAERARALGLVDMVICHGTRCGRSAAINAAARFASGDLLLTVDADTVFEPTAVARLAAAFSDPRVGGASCNIAISNERDSIWTGLQSVEYLMSISAGKIHPRRRGRDRLSVRRLLDVSARHVPAARRPRRRPRRGSGVQPAAAPPRLSHPLRAGCLGGNRRAGKRHKPVAPARALGSRCVANPLHDVWRTEIFPSLERLPDTLQRLDFIVFDLIPTLSLPFYLVYVVLLFGDECRCVSRRGLCPAALDLDFQHGAGVRHVQSIDRLLRSWRRR